MESGRRTNCFTGRKVTAKFAAFIGMIFGVGLVAFIIFVYTQMNTNFLLSLFAFVANITATILWLLGCLQEKKKLMLVSLVCWGTPLNLWLGFVFLWTIRVFPYGPDLHYKYSTVEVVTPTISAVFVMFYIALMMIYYSMDKYMEHLVKFNWKLCGMIAGWVLIAFSVGQTSLFYYQRNEWDLYHYGFFVLFALNLIAAGTWLYGLTKVKKGVMMVSLVCWSIPLALWTGLMIYSMTQKDYRPGDRRHYNPIHSISIFYVFLYVVLASTVGSVRNEIESNQFDITYAPPPQLQSSSYTPHKKLNV